MQETNIKKIPDNIVDNWFDGGATSQNIITPTEKLVEDNLGETNKEPEKKPELKPVMVIPDDDFSIASLVIPEEKEEEIITPTLGSTKKKEVVTPEISGLKIKLESLLKKDDKDEDGVLFPFDDDTPVKDEKDLKELIRANQEEIKKTATETAIESFLGALPEDVKYIVDYVRNGGRDTASIYNLLNNQIQALSLDTSTPQGSENVIYTYYKDLGWSDEEINQTVDDLKDAGEEKLKARADKLKEKVTQIRSEELAEQAEAQKQMQEQQKQAQTQYINTIQSTLKKGTIGDIKLTKEDQADLYSGLVLEQYKTPYGTVTNRLGAKLDEIQFIKPNYELLAEVMMLLTDRDKYHKTVREVIKKEVNQETVRKIKMEQTLKPGTTTNFDNNTEKKVNKIFPTFKQNPFN